MSKLRIAALTLVAASLAACNEPAPSSSQPRPVRVVTVQSGTVGETIALTGQIRAKDQANLGFRIDGRMIGRSVNVGDVVEAGQIIARLAPENQKNEQRSAEASLAAAEARLTQARLAFGRQQTLLKDGWTTQVKFDEAQQAFLTAQAEVDSARAQLRIAQDRLSYTTLFADARGTVTAVGAEPGEVVRAGQMIVQLARQGGRDAVFDVPEQLIRSGPRDPFVQIVLTNDPTVRATGRVREVAPEADSRTRTFQVKVGIIDPPEAMRLGAIVTGSIRLAAPPGVAIPASALTEANKRPAVWTVDAQTQTVSLRPVDVQRYDSAEVLVSQGLHAGDIVVTAGIQLLHPGQAVRLMETAR